MAIAPRCEIHGARGVRHALVRRRRRTAGTAANGCHRGPDASRPIDPVTDPDPDPDTDPDPVTDPDTDPVTDPAPDPVTDPDPDSDSDSVTDPAAQACRAGVIS